MRRIFGVIAVTCGVVLSGGSIASAATNYTWTGSASTPDFSNATNWGGSAPSGTVGTLDFPLLSGCAAPATCTAGTNNLTGLSASGVEIASNADYDITGSAITIGSGGLDISPTASVTNPTTVFDVPITLSASNEPWTLDAAASGEPIELGPITGSGDTLDPALTADPNVELTGDNEVGSFAVSGYGTITLPSGGALNGSDGSPVSVGSGTTLAVPLGSATVGALSDGGQVTAGGNGHAATMTINGGIGFSSNGVLALSIPSSGTSAGTNYSSLSATGTVNLSGAGLMLSVGTASSCPTLAPGEVLTLITTTGQVDGTFNSYANGTTIGLPCPGGGAEQTATINYTSSTVTLTVAKDPTFITTSCPSTAIVGQPTTCTVTVQDQASTDPTAPTGTVSFSVSSGQGSFSPTSCTLAASGTASSSCSVSITPSASGSIDYAVTYGGDASHAASESQSSAYAQPPASTSTELNCAPAALNVGATATCTFEVSGGTTAPTGTVAMSASSSNAGLSATTCTLQSSSNFTASCQVTASPTATGSYAITATYGGDSSHAGSHGTATLTVSDSTTTAVACSPQTVTPGTPIDCTVTVTDTASSPTTPTGSITLSGPPKAWYASNGCSLAAGTAPGSATCSFTLNPTSGSSARVSVAYTGDGGHQRSSATTELQGTSSGSTGPVSGPPGTQCADPDSAQSDPHNRLMLAQAPPPSDPLRGANLFVNGPTHGFAAGAIAQLLGIDTNVPVDSALSAFPETETWAQFAADIPGLEAKAGTSTQVDNEITLLEKIASEPETQRISVFSQGGNIYSQTQKLFCHNFLADPGAVPVISTYFLHPKLGGCPSPAQIKAYKPQFEDYVNELAEGTGNRPAVFLVEIDGIGSSSCMAHRGDLGLWLKLIKYEDLKLMSLPHTLVYVEGGYSDANSPRYTAHALLKVGIKKITGFWTNDTHINWTIKEIKWGEKISRMTGGAHFVVNTAQNGHGPKLNPHPTTQGVEDLCNPPGRGLGPQPTANTGFPHVDAFIWSSPPGISSGSCGGGTPSGTFWVAHAVSEAALANQQLGPGYPSRPY